MGGDRLGSCYPLVEKPPLVGLSRWPCAADHPTGTILDRAPRATSGLSNQAGTSEQTLATNVSNPTLHLVWSEAPPR